jgi:hypothetical protein
VLVNEARAHAIRRSPDLPAADRGLRTVERTIAPVLRNLLDRRSAADVSVNAVGAMIWSA